MLPLAPDRGMLEKDLGPCLVRLSGLGVVPQTESLLVQFQSGCQPGPRLGVCKKQPIHVSLAHRGFSLPSLLSKNKQIKYFLKDLGLLTLRSSNEESHLITQRHHHQATRLTPHREPLPVLVPRSQLLDWVGSDYLGGGIRGTPPPLFKILFIYF